MSLKNPLLSLILIAFLTLPARIVAFQAVQNVPVKITSPQEADVIQGVLAIHGTTDIPGFHSAEVTFAYQNNPTATWFLIQQSSTPVKNDVLASWDTSTITDGEYQLRVQVLLNDGKVVEKVVKNLRVRNYTPVEISVPDQSSANQTQVPTQTPLADFQVTGATPVPLPTNPAELTSQNLQESALKGVMVVFAALAVAGVYLGIQAIIRR
jgi:hypothetical protein